jgi:hypothetical protein
MTISYNAEAYRLLEAIYELADGNPERVVASAKVTARTDIPHTLDDFYRLARHLKELGLIRTTSTGGVGIVGMFKITPTGIRLVEAIRPS